jgi:membrane-associated phospholipid phosphatase
MPFRHRSTLVPASAVPAGHVLPAPRHWIVWVCLLSALLIALGLMVRVDPFITTAELVVDQQLSDHHVTALTALALALNALFGPVAGALIIVAVAFYLVLVKRDRINAVAFVLTAGWGWTVCQILKIVFGRIRPDPAALFDPLVPEPVSYSFPSGHTSLAVALTFAFYFLARNTRWAKPAFVVGVLVSITVAWSRVYIGAHYPADVIASFLATPAAVFLLAGLWNRYFPRIPDRFRPAAGRRDGSPHGRPDPSDR